MESDSEENIFRKPVDIARQRFRIRLRFRGIARLAYKNRVWLRQEDKSPSTKAKRLLTLADKKVLNSNPCDRTPAEIHRIYKIIMFLKSLRTYSKDSQLKVAERTRYCYYEANRIIVKQHHQPMAIYFIVSGECEESSTYYDKILREEVMNFNCTLTAGASFGEYALLHDTLRNTTVRTLTHCEFIYLNADDFNTILRRHLLLEWQALIAEMDSFTYFDPWSVVTKRECCAIAKVRSYNRDDTIFDKCQERGLQYVYFILEGECVMIEYLLVHENTYDGIFDQRLFTHKEEDKIHAAALQHVSFNLNASRNVAGYSRSRMHIGKNASFSKLENRAIDKLTRRLEDIPSYVCPEYEDEMEETAAAEPLVFINMAERLPSDVVTHFMKICTFSEKACFNIGENLRRRCIVATNDVKALLIPFYWLKGKGYCNIWNQIKHHLNRQIPTTEQVYAEYLEKCKFRRYVKDFVSTKQRNEVNCVGNIPFSTRVAKDFKIYTNK